MNYQNSAKLNPSLERSLGNTFFGLFWLVFSLINIIWGISNYVAFKDFLADLEPQVIFLIIVNGVFSSFTLIIMGFFGIAVIIAKLYGAHVSLNYCERIAKLKSAKIQGTKQKQV